jgi:glycosyltransferase involved in cell wall biosynthesis
MMTHSTDQPLITLLFPLYRSKQFLNKLIDHFDRLTSADINIIVSDRHCYDDTIEVLRERYGTDPRFSFFSATDEMNWVKHYNFLISRVTGKYFSFVPHDDHYETGYYNVLANELEQKPSAVMAFSLMHVTGATDWVPDYSIFRKNYKYPFSVSQYFRFLYSNIIGVAFRGVFRTSTVQGKKLFIKENDRVTMYQDYYWIFALLERGDFIYTEKTSCTKFFRKDGASGHWDYTRFFKKNKAARKIIYEYTFSSPLPLVTKFRIYSGLEMRRWKVRATKMIRPLAIKKSQ